MLRVSHLRKLVKPSAPCRDILVDLLGTEVGAPVSAGLPVNIPYGTVVATGAGYDFTNGVLSVTTAGSCPLSSETTFSITGTGPVPALHVYGGASSAADIFVGVTGDQVYAAYRPPESYPPPQYWASGYVPVAISAGAPYELKCSLADTWVGVWLNGTRIARADVSPGALKIPGPWTVIVGAYYSYSEMYTGHVDSVSLANGALPDIDVL